MGRSTPATIFPVTSTDPATMVDQINLAFRDIQNTLAQLDGGFSRQTTTSNAVNNAQLNVAALLQPQSISSTMIADSAITTLKIAAAAVTNALIAANAVGSTQIIAGSILSSNIAAGTIQGDRIAAATITGANIAALTITAANIVAGTITANEIAASTITGAKIAANTITASNLSVSTLSAITANLGSVTIGASGSLSSGQTAYNTGTGFWLEYNAGTPRMSFGSAAGNKLLWDGSSLTINATSFVFGKFSLQSGTSGFGSNGYLTSDPTAFTGFYPTQIGNTYVANRDSGTLQLTGVLYPGVTPWYSYRILIDSNDGITFYRGSSSTSPAAAVSALAVVGTIVSGVSSIRYNHTTEQLFAIAGTDCVDLTSANTKVGNGLRLQPLTASAAVAKTTVQHRVSSGWTAPASGTSFNITIDLTNMGFSAAPNFGLANALGANNYDIAYRDDLSSSTSAVFTVYKRSGPFASEMIWAKLLIATIA